MICRLILVVFALAYLLALLALAVGTFGLFGSERGPLAGVFLLPLGLPWALLAGRLPDGAIRMGAVMLAPLVNLGIIAALCRMTRQVVPVVVACLSVTLVGCHTPADERGAPGPTPHAGGAAAARVPQAATSASPLAGTAWRLVEIQSMDDSVGTAWPDDPSVYTMRLHEDGTVAMRLSCNRATGTWSAETGPDGASGRFEFGPLAATRALCPPPSLDERVTAQASYVRSYLLKDGRLHLSLMADGGIVVWEPLRDLPYETTPDKDLEAAVLGASPSYTRAVVDVEGGTGRGRYVYGRVDLNGDGRDEVFVYLLGSIFCGSGGCNLLLLSPAERGGYSLIDEFPISRLPVIVSPSRTNVARRGEAGVRRRREGLVRQARVRRHALRRT